MGLVWAMVAKSSGQWSDFGLIRGHFRLESSDQRPFREHVSLIGGYFGLGWSDQKSLPDGPSTWECFKIIKTLKIKPKMVKSSQR